MDTKTIQSGLPPVRPLAALTESLLERRLRALAWGEKQVLAGFLKHLDEFDQRRRHAPNGYPSLFRYCTKELGLSEDEAYLRIQAARLSRNYPQILDMLSRGQTSLSCLAKLSPCLTRANAAEVLAEARGKSKREVERMAAGYAAGPTPQADRIRFLPWPCAAAATQGADTGQKSPASAASAAGSAMGKENPISQPVRIAFTASEYLVRKIDRARALLRHKFPSGRLESLVNEAFDELLNKRDPDRRPPRAASEPQRQAKKPRSPASTARSRRIPRRVRETVWRRDGGRCAFISSQGKRCEAQQWLEYDHILPFALGGSSTEAANIRLACRTHNLHAAACVFGDKAWPKRSKAV
ncbi:MAG: HNH endonuclease [Elusimicrobia bacterium]|nr:HNH endonuclease [Elusimicrobiota bacterium]